MLSHADRTRIIADGDVRQLFTSPGVLVGPVLIDGFVGARWKIVRDRGQATLIVESFDRLRRDDRAPLAEEGVRLLAFAAPDARTHEVRLARGG